MKLEEIIELDRIIKIRLNSIEERRLKIKLLLAEIELEEDFMIELLKKAENKNGM